MPGHDYAAVVEQRAPSRIQPGTIVDSAGRVLARHDGIHHFTVGQRKGLGIAAPGPLHVIRIEAATRTVVVGPREMLGRTTLEAERVNWIAGAEPTAPIRASAQIRYRHPAAPATIEPMADARVRVTFDLPQAAITPGQAVVFYDGDETLGGGWIEG